MHGDYDHSQDYAGDIDSRNNVLGIVQTSHFDLANLEGQDKRECLENSLVSIQNAQCDVT